MIRRDAHRKRAALFNMVEAQLRSPETATVLNEYRRLRHMGFSGVQVREMIANALSDYLAQTLQGAARETAFADYLDRLSRLPDAE